MVICLERGADLHMAQLMPMPLTVSCFSKIQIGFTFMVLAHPGSPGKRAVKWVCVCVCDAVDQWCLRMILDICWHDWCEIKENCECQHLVNGEESSMNCADVTRMRSVMSLMPLSTRPGPRVSAMDTTRALTAFRISVLR